MSSTLKFPTAAVRFERHNGPNNWATVNVEHLPMGTDVLPELMMTRWSHTVLKIIQDVGGWKPFSQYDDIPPFEEVERVFIEKAEDIWSFMESVRTNVTLGLFEADIYGFSLSEYIEPKLTNDAVLKLIQMESGGRTLVDVEVTPGVPNPYSNTVVKLRWDGIPKETEYELADCIIEDSQQLIAEWLYDVCVEDWWHS